MHYENLVFGATLDSLFFATKSGYPLVYTNPKHPPFYQEQKMEMWEGAYFLLSLSGKILFTDKIKRFKYMSTGSYSVLTERKTYDITCDNLFIFDEGVSSLPSPQSDNEFVRVYDYMNIRGTLPEECSVISGENYNIYILNSTRSRRPDVKDLCLVREINKKQLSDESNSELFSRFFVEQETEAYFGRPLRIEVEKRLVENIGLPTYPEIEGIKFIKDEISLDWSSEDEYIRKLIGGLVA